MNEQRTKIAWKHTERTGEIVFQVESKRWLKAHVTELRVGDLGLEATGDLGGYTRGTMRLSWTQVTELHYGPAGGGAIDGLYAREGEWCSRCVLPWVSEAQAEEVITAIAMRYPRMAKMPESALEIAIGGTVEHQAALSRRGWLPVLGHRGVAVAAPLGRV